MILFLSAFATVFLLVFQQQNVIYRQYSLAVLTSALITITQFAVIKGVADGSLVDMVYMIVGGMLGVLSSMKSHEAMVRWFQRKNHNNGPKTGEATQISGELAPAIASRIHAGTHFFGQSGHTGDRKMKIATDATNTVIVDGLRVGKLVREGSRPLILCATGWWIQPAATGIEWPGPAPGPTDSCNRCHYRFAATAGPPGTR